MYSIKSKKIFSSIMLFAFMLQIGLSSFAIGETTNFQDIRGHYAEETINEWIQKDLISGFPDGSFKPDDNVTRAEYVALLNRAFKHEPVDQTQKLFNDVMTDDWFYVDVMLAASLGIIAGYPDGNFGPDDPITRQDACVIISRYLSLTDDFDQSYASKFSDSDEISDYAVEHIAAAASFKIVNGRPDGTFAPNEYISRADSVIMLNNALIYFKTELADNDIPLSGSQNAQTQPKTIPKSNASNNNSINESNQDDSSNAAIDGNSNLGGGAGSGGSNPGGGGSIGGDQSNSDDNKIENNIEDETEDEVFFSITDIKVNRDTNTLSLEVSATKVCFLEIKIIEDEVEIKENWENARILANENVLINDILNTDFVDIPVSISLPKYFVVIARLVDDSRKDLCDSVIFIDFTNAYEKFLESTIFDYENNKIINLDDSIDNNFMVVANDVSIINAGYGGYNNFAQINENTYLFSSASINISSLGVDKKIAVLDNNGNDLHFIRIASVETNGTEVIINANIDNDPFDFLDLVKIEIDEYVDNPIIDTSDSDEGVIFYPSLDDMPDYSIIDNNNNDLTTMAITTKSAINGIGFGISVDSAYVKLEASTTIKNIKLNGHIKFWTAIFYSYLDVDISIEVETEFNGQIVAKYDNTYFKDKKLTEPLIAYLYVPTAIPGLAVDSKLTCPLEWEVSGGLNFTSKMTTKSGFTLKGSYITAVPIQFSFNTYSSRQCTSQISATGEINIKIGPKYDISANVLAGLGKAGLYIYGGLNLKGSVEIPLISTGESRHECGSCVKGSVDFFVQLGYDYGFCWGVFRGSAKIAEIRVELFKIHISLSNPVDSIYGGKANGGIGDCPIISYRTTFSPVSGSSVIQNAVVTIKKSTGSTIYSGIGSFDKYLFPGNYVVSADLSGYIFSERSFTVINRAQTVNISSTIAVSDVTLNKSAINLNINTSELLIATINPSNAGNRTVTWSSDNTGIATVNNGRVTAVAPGTAVISVRTSEGGKTAFCTVTVAPIAVTGVYLNRVNYSQVFDENAISQFTLIATVTPLNATNQTVIWNSSDPSVATVDSNGLVILVSPGNAIITATTVDGNRTASCTVMVNVRVSGVSLNKDALTLELASTEALIVTILPDNATNKAVIWNSNASYIASVDNQGVVTAGPILGTAIITARTIDGGYTATCTVTVVPVPVASVTLDVTDTSLHVGENMTLSATVNPDNATNKSVIWSSDRPSVATVINGRVTAVAIGTAIITVRTTDGDQTAICSVNVMPISVDNVSLNKTDTSIIQGYTERLISTVSPENATDKSIVWSSDNPDIATVDSSGEVRAISIGSAIITATTVDGSKTTECTVNVLPIPVNGVSLNRELAYIFVIGNAINLESYVFPTNAANQNINWSSDDLNIATVNSEGKVTAVSEGTARITATTVDGGYEATCIVIVTSRKTAIDVAAGSGHNMVVANDGSLWAWGANWDGQLGIGDNDPYIYYAYAPIQVGTDTDWVSVTVGNDHTLAIKADGTLWGWGSNVFGEVGLYDYVAYVYSSNSNIPIQIGSDSDWSSVTTGDSVTFAIKTDGTLWTFGYNSAYYNNPVDEPYSFYTPVQFGTDANWDSVTIASDSDMSHVLALKTDGTIWAWGENWSGQLGIGFDEAYKFIDSPVQVGTDSDWTSVLTGGRITFAIKTNGTLWTWGQNLENKGSDDVDVPYVYYIPNQVGIDTNWVSVTTGKFDGYMIALKADGSMWAWGPNWYGQLGMGYDEDTGGGEYYILVQVGSDSDWVSVVAGKEFTIALKLDGSMWAWGRAPIGDGTDINSYIPVIIWS